MIKLIVVKKEKICLLRVFTLDDNNSDAGDVKNALERTLSLKPHPTEHNDPFESDGEDSKNSSDRSNAKE